MLRASMLRASSFSLSVERACAAAQHRAAPALFGAVLGVFGGRAGLLPSGSRSCSTFKRTKPHVNVGTIGHVVRVRLLARGGSTGKSDPNAHSFLVPHAARAGPRQDDVDGRHHDDACGERHGEDDVVRGH